MGCQVSISLLSGFYDDIGIVQQKALLFEASKAEQSKYSCHYKCNDYSY